MDFIEKLAAAEKLAKSHQEDQERNKRAKEEAIRKDQAYREKNAPIAARQLMKFIKGEEGRKIISFLEQVKWSIGLGNVWIPSPWWKFGSNGETAHVFLSGEGLKVSYSIQKGEGQVYGSRKGKLRDLVAVCECRKDPYEVLEKIRTDASAKADELLKK
jgi:hypothetical protein